MSVSSVLYGRSREAELYGEDLVDRRNGMYESDGGPPRPTSDRVSSIGGYFVNLFLEKLLRAIPPANEHTTIGQTLNAIKEGLITRYNVNKHRNALTVLENPIPIANDVLQNFWSFAHLHDGLTSVDVAYTVERGGNEYLIDFATPVSVPDLASLRSTAERFRGREDARIHELLSEIPPDSEAIRAGAIAEMTDYDIHDRSLRDIDKFQPLYSKAELWFIGRKGSRSVVGQTANGENIVAYRRPGAGDFWNYYLRMDWGYTAHDKAIGAAEKVLGSGVAGQRVYEREVGDVVKNACDYYGNLRDDGFINPFWNYRLVGSI